MPAKVMNELSPEELARHAQADLNEDPKRVKADIKHIQDWVKKQPHLNKYIDASKILHENEDDSGLNMNFIANIKLGVVLRCSLWCEYQIEIKVKQIREDMKNSFSFFFNDRTKK